MVRSDFFETLSGCIQGEASNGVVAAKICWGLKLRLCFPRNAFFSTTFLDHYCNCIVMLGLRILDRKNDCEWLWFDA